MAENADFAKLSESAELGMVVTIPEFNQLVTLPDFQKLMVAPELNKIASMTDLEHQARGVAADIGGKKTPGDPKVRKSPLEIVFKEPLKEEVR
jgi:hypothetical protein